MSNVDASQAPGMTKVLDYIIAVAAVVIAALVVHWTSAYFLPTPTPAPVSVFFCAILLSAWRGSLPGGLAFLLSLVSLYYFFCEPSGTFKLGTRDEVRLAYFALVGIGITALGAAKGEALKAAWSANHDLALAVADLQHINRQLEIEGEQRERANEKLRFGEALLTEGQRISHTGSWLLNVKSNKLLWSEEHYRIFGYEPEVGEPTFGMASQRIHDEDRERVSRIVREAMKTLDRFECAYRIMLPSGEIRHIQATGYPAHNSHAGHCEYIGISADVTERRQAEELLQRSEREFRTLAENSPDCVIRYDLDCRRIYVNPAYERTRGFSASAMLHQPLAANWHWDTPVAEYTRRLRRIIKTGEPDQMFGVWQTPGEKPIHCAIQAVAERDTDGSVVSVLCIIRDVTSIKQAELRLEESQNMLRQLANRSETVREEERKHLARELHDDLAQYLLALRMKISVLDFEFGQRHPTLTQSTTSMIGLVDSSITVVRNIITSLRPAALDMGIVSALEWLVQEFIAKTGISCELNSFTEAIPISEACAVAFFRIAQEALRNTARHAGATKVEVAFKRRDANYVLEVKDNGVGFDVALKKPASFGLVGIRERALMMGGKIDIYTSQHAGTSIQVFIPFRTPSPKE